MQIFEIKKILSFIADIVDFFKTIYYNVYNSKEKEIEKMIAFAQEKSGTVYVYNERNVVMFTRPGTLLGYTNSTVSIKKEGALLTYNDKGIVISRR